mgnify:CR=1 FL=1
MAARRSGDPRRLDPLSGRFTDYIVIDTETTGLSVRKGARLIEIGAVKIHNDELVDEFDQLINPFEHVPSRITGLTGIDDGMLLGKSFGLLVLRMGQIDSRCKQQACQTGC